MPKQKFLAISITLVMLLSLMGPSFGVYARPLAQTAPPLGVLQSYSVLAHTGVTNSGPTSMPGNIGSDTASIGGGITVGPPGTSQDAAHALVAQNDAVTAKNSLESQGPGTTLPSPELAGLVLTHGVYTVPGVSLLSSNVLGGVLTLDGPGVYIFLTSGLTASGTVNLINGADACNVYWRDASSVAINNSGTSGSFIGTIIALASITMNTGAKLEGRAIAQTGDVTLLSNTITGPTCGTTPTTKLLNSDESPVSSNTPANTVTTASPVHDSVTIVGATGVALTGTVTYKIYSDPTCQTPATDVTGGITDTQTIANGNVPNSIPFTFPNVGDYYFQATYNGDNFNLKSTSACNEPLFVIPAGVTLETPTLTTSLSATNVPVGPAAIINDTAILDKGAGTQVPTGTVAYSYYTDDQCTLGYQDAGTVTLSGGTIPNSNQIPFTTAGKYYWQAIYSGDSNYVGVITACNAANEVLTITKLSPTITTRLSRGFVPVGGAVFDSATLIGATSNAIGTVTYTVYTNNTCTSPLVGQIPFSVKVTNGQVPDSNPITFNTPGVYYWQAVYVGGPNNNGATSACIPGNNEMLLVGSVRPPGPFPTGVPTPGGSGTSPTSVPSASVLPGTGFAPQRATTLPKQSTSYANLGDLWLEIPHLGVQMAIVGVPKQADGDWDVSWLGNDAGWLNGTAFPTHAGNSVLTGHVYEANGNPGPFVHLNGLWYGDQVIVHAWGAQYVYEVRSVLQVTPGATSSVIKHQTLPWVTLITCRGYDEASNTYKYRVAVSAVLVAVK